MNPVISLLRPKEWVKNLFLYAPLFFGGALLDTHKFILCSIGFVVFSAAASAVYIFNDLRDLEFDRQHPAKKLRPLAANLIGTTVAWVILAVLVLVSLVAAFLLNPAFALVIALYLLLNLAYSIQLKHIAIIDVTCIAAGFLLRIIGGGIIAAIVLSPWLLIMTFLVSLFMGFGKRRDDVLLLHHSGTRMRKSIDGYNLEFINAAMVVMASVLIVCYINYITSPEVVARIAHPYFFVSAFFVTIALLRYLQIVLVEQKSSSPTKIVTGDAVIVVMVVCWLLHFAFSIYAHNDLLQGFVAVLPISCLA